MFTSSIIHQIRCCYTSRFTLGHWNGCCPRESNFLCVTDFLKVRWNWLGELPWISRERTNELPMTIPEARTQSGSTNHEKLRKWNVPNSRNLVLFTHYVRLGAKSYAKLDSNFQNAAGFWALLWMFLRLIYPKVSWNTNWFSLHQCSRFLFLWSRWNHFYKPVLLTVQKKFAFHFCASEVDFFVLIFKIKGWMWGFY